MLNSADLAYMRAAIAELLPDTCNILSVTYSPDGMGGNTETWGTVSASVACRLDIQTGQTSKGEVVIADSVRPFQQTILSLPYSTTILTSDRVEHGGFTYNVSRVNTDQSWIAVKRVILERV